MPIYGRNLPEVGRVFQDHFNSILAKTISGKPLIPVTYGETLQIGFRDGGDTSSAPLKTRYGPMDLYLGQICDAVEEANKQLRLRTINYGYGLQPHGMDEPLFRWEYIRYPASDSVYCRHHLQGLITLEITDDRDHKHAINLNHWHLPTGWVAIEEVIRFCIVDLGVKPLSETWDQVLRESHETFRSSSTHMGEA